MAQKTQIIEKIFKIERTKYAIRYTKDENEDRHIDIAKISPNREVPIAQFLVNAWTAPESFPQELIGWADSSSAEEGEIAYQMFSPRVFRKPYKAGIVIMATDSTVYNWKELQREGMLERAIIVLLSGLKEKWLSSRGLIYFTYFGSDIVPDDKKFFPILKKNNFAVFRCVEGMCAEEDAFIALYSSEVIGNESLTKKQAATKERPKKNPEGYIDYRLMENVEYSDKYFSSSSIFGTKAERFKITSKWDDCYGIASYCFNVERLPDKKGKTAHSGDSVFWASFTVTNFRLEGPNVLKKFKEAFPEEMEVGKQLFYPPVQREAACASRLFLLKDIDIPNRTIFDDNPTLFRDIWMAVLDRLRWSMDEAELEFHQHFIDNGCIAYLGRLDLPKEYLQTLKYNCEKEEAVEAHKQALIMYDLCKKAGIPTIRCLEKGKTAFGENHFISFITSEDIYWFECAKNNNYDKSDEEEVRTVEKYLDKNKTPILPPRDEFPPVLTKKAWTAMLKDKQKSHDEWVGKYGYRTFPDRAHRVFNYSEDADFLGKYTVRDLFAYLQEDKYRRHEPNK